MKRKKKTSFKKLCDKLDKIWGLCIRTRDGKCIKCGSRSTLAAHHVFGKKANGYIARWMIDNGVTLCYAHHIHWAHHDTGGFYKFWEDRVGRDRADEIAVAVKAIWKPTEEELEQKLKALTAIAEKYEHQ